MIDVRRAESRFRGGDPGAGIDTRHAFSFGGHYDPHNLRFGLLLACNEERLEPGAGFAEHPHRDTEIVTWVTEGELEHRDAEGRTSRLGAGGLQVLSAGGGLRHSEANAGGSRLVFVQMWLHPDDFGGAPRYDRNAEPALSASGLTLLASGLPRHDAELCSGSALRLRQRAAALHAARPVAAVPEQPLPVAPFLYVHVVRGPVRVGEETLHAGDAARITGSDGSEGSAVTHVAADGPAEYLVWEMHAEPSYG